MKAKLLLLGGALAAGALGADPAVVARGEKEEARSCIACHSLRIVHSQRLSKAAWGRELDKMAGWGTKVEHRDALVEYLTANFGDDKPPQPIVLTKDGSQQKK
jgi:mono/diheme cytochrome c family protein